RWPGKIKAGTVTSQQIITMDFTATILALGGAKPDPSFPPDGKNIMPVCQGKEKPFARSFYWRISQRNQEKSMLDDHWKWLKDKDGSHLFDLSTDPAEAHDLGKEHPDILLRLEKKYAAWEAEMLKPLDL